MSEMFPAGHSGLTVLETAHRYGARLAVAGLLFLSTSAVFAHDVGRGPRGLLAGAGELGTLCLTALETLFDPVHYAFHAIFAAGLLYAAYDRLRAWRVLRGTVALLEARSPAPGDVFWQAAADAQVDPRRVRIVDGLANPALTAGVFRPRIYLAAALGSSLTAEQLAAVLAHEGAHVARRDPLRLSVLRFLACTLFWLPALRRLTDDLADEAEVRADDCAARGRPLVLAQAILAVARGAKAGESEPAVPAFHHNALLERRIRRLAGAPGRAGSRLTPRSVAWALGVLALAWASGLAAAQPAASIRADHAPRCTGR